jgi:hypothetical protein
MGSICDVRVAEKSDPVIPSYERRIPVCMYARLLTVLTFALVVPTMAVTTNGVIFNVRQENGVDQYYRLEVPPNLPPAKPDTGKISQNEVPVIRWIQPRNSLTIRSGFEERAPEESPASCPCGNRERQRGQATPRRFGAMDQNSNGPKVLLTMM